jgi:hypothetical protein
MVQKSASTRRLKTALDIIYAGTNFQNPKCARRVDAAKMRALSEAHSEKPRAA